MRGLLACVLLAVAASAGANPAGGDADLLVGIQARLGTARVTRGQYEQTRVLEGISRPLRDTGSFTVDRERGVLWRTTTPFAGELRISHEEILQREGGQTLMQLSAQREPAVRAVCTVLFALFAADLNTLARYFDYAGEQDAHGWSLRLVPRDAGMRRIIRGIALNGDRTVAHAELTAASGDLLRIDFRGVATANALTPAEAAAFE
jgi:hypothetical protein